MNESVVEGAKLRCNKGTAITQLKVTSKTFVKINGKPQATEGDIQSNSNIVPFGDCKLKPKKGGFLPCLPIPIKWEDTSPFSIDGMKELTTESFCNCSIGGKVTILESPDSAFESLVLKPEVKQKNFSSSDNSKDQETSNEEPTNIYILTNNKFGLQIELRYARNGDLFEQKGNNWSLFRGELDKDAKSHVELIKGWLKELENNSAGKKELIDFFGEDKINKNKYRVNISGTNERKRNVYDYKEFKDKKMETVFVTKIQTKKLTVKGEQLSPVYISMAHEIAHSKSKQLGWDQKYLWEIIINKAFNFQEAKIDEIYACHIENKIRQIANESLRTNYADEPSVTKLLDESNKRSLHINKKEEYPKVKDIPKDKKSEPIIINEKDRYEY